MAYKGTFLVEHQCLDSYKHVRKYIGHIQGLFLKLQTSSFQQFNYWYLPVSDRTAHSVFTSQTKQYTQRDNIVPLL